MSTKIYVNLPVKDLPKSVEFFTKTGFSLDTQLADDNSAHLVIGDDIYVLLVAESFFSTLTNKKIADARTSTEAIIALAVDSRQRVDDLVEAALTAGGQAAGDTQDHGFMYSRGFQDLDGHIWNVLHMDETAMQEAE